MKMKTGLAHTFSPLGFASKCNYLAMPDYCVSACAIVISA